MKYEYLLFNIIVISGPVIFGSMKRFYFLDKAKSALISLSIPLIPFLVWDAAVTGRHWFFSSEYTLGFRILNLPPEEILFFVSVPYACLFTWEMINRFTKDKEVDNLNVLYLLPIPLFAAAVYFFTINKEYTALVMVSSGIMFLVDKYLKTELFLHKNFYYYLLLVAVFTILFNGYLTWRPVVTYDPIYQLDFRIWTVPVEDFLFGFSLLFIATSIFIKLEKGKNERSFKK